jgi:hypothetical protein
MLLFADPGGKFYGNTTQMTQGLYAAISGVQIVTSGLPAGADGTTAIQSITNGTFNVNTTSTSGPYTIGCRFYIPGSIGAGQNICVFFDGSLGSQLTFQTNANGTIAAKRGGGNGTLLGTSNIGTPLVANTWQYVEFSMFCSGSVGTVQIQINNILALNLTGQNTQGTGNTTVAQLQLQGMNTQTYFQDIYVTDSTGSTNVGFLGDVKMPVLYPNGPGNYNQYAPSGAATIWQCVDDPTPDDLATFAFDSTVGDRMSVDFNPIAVSGSILGVVHYSRVSKSDAGARTFAQTLTSNGVDQIGSNQSPATTFGYFTQMAPVDPATEAAWTSAGLNALQGGLKTIS